MFAERERKDMIENELKKQHTLKEAIVKYQKFMGNVRQKKKLFSGLINTFVENYQKNRSAPGSKKK